MRVALWLVVALHCVIYLTLVLEMRAFVASTNEIDSIPTLDRYRAFARRQMWGAAAALGYLPVFLFLLIMYGRGSWWPVLPFIVLTVFNKRVAALQEQARTLPCRAELREHYDEITRIWVAKLFPRFPAVSQVASTPTRSEHVRCRVHGPTSAASACPRCGTFSCDLCVSSGKLGQSRCRACQARYEGIREASWADEQRVRMSGVVLVGLGVSELTVASMLLQTARHSSHAHTAGLWLLMIFGGLVSVIGVGTMNLLLRTKLPAMLAAIPHLWLFPIGTGACGYVLFAQLTPTALHPLSSEYADIVAMTPWRGHKHLYVSLAACTLFIPIYVAFLDYVLTRLLFAHA